MIAIARGSITEPDKLGPFIDDKMRVVEQLKAEGVMKRFRFRNLLRRRSGSKFASPASSRSVRYWKPLQSDVPRRA